MFTLFIAHTHAHQSSNLFLTFPIYFFSFLILLFYLTLPFRSSIRFLILLSFFMFSSFCVSFILIRMRVVGRTAISNLLEIQSNISHMFSHMHISRIHLYIHTYIPYIPMDFCGYLYILLL